MTPAQEFQTLMQNISSESRTFLGNPDLHRLQSNSSSDLFVTLKQNIESLDRTVNSHLQNSEVVSKDWISQLTETLRNLNLTPTINKVGKIQDIPASVATEILKMATEIATNARKHGDASQMRILLVFQPRSLRITFSDNGKGMKDPTDSSSVGLINLQTRAAKINATIKQSTASNASLSTHLQCPLNQPIADVANAQTPDSPASLGRELHDMICPQIMSVTFALRSLAKTLPPQYASEAYALNQAFEMFSASFKHARNISHQLIKLTHQTNE